MWCKTRGNSIIETFGVLVLIVGVGCTTPAAQNSDGQAEEQARVDSPGAESAERPDPSPTAAAEGPPATGPAETAATAHGAPLAEPLSTARLKESPSTEEKSHNAASDGTSQADPDPSATQSPDGADAIDSPNPADSAADSNASTEQTAEQIAAQEAKRIAEQATEATSTKTSDAPAAASSATSPGADEDGEGEEQAPYDVTVQQTEVDTVLHVKPLDHALPRVDYRPDSRSLQLHFDSERPAQDQSAELTGMLKQLADELQAALLPSELRMSATTENYPEFAARLAQHAAKDPEWRKQQREVARMEEAAQAGALQAYAITTNEKASLASELDQVFLPLGLRLELSEAGHCSLAKPNDRFLRKHKVRTAIKVPAGCETLLFRFKQLGTNGEELSEVETSEEAAL